jgi:transposase
MYIPEAEVVFDVFHLNQFVMKAMDEVRRIEAKNDSILLKKTRYLRLYNQKRLDDNKKGRLAYIMSKNSALALAYQIKENFKDFFSK